MSQASANASKESAPRIESSGSQPSSGGAMPTGVARSGNLKPKKKARQGF